MTLPAPTLHFSSILYIFAYDPRVMGKDVRHKNSFQILFEFFPSRLTGHYYDRHLEHTSLIVNINNYMRVPSENLTAASTQQE